MAGIRATQEDELHRLEGRYQQLTGRDGYLYAYNPGDPYGKRYVFSTGPTVFGASNALARMRMLVADAERRRSEREGAAEPTRQAGGFDHYIRFANA